MVGYSDSGKDGGYLAAQWAIYRTQEALADLARRRRDRADDLPRPRRQRRPRRGPTYAAILAQAPGYPPGGLKLTEQGETVSFKYGLPGLAYRNLEAALAGTRAERLPRDRRAGRRRPTSGRCSTGWRRVAERAYRSLVFETPGFVDFFRTFTPVDELALLEIGSRPSRRTDGPDYLGSLRAIPWVFAWTQNRTLLPAWYGCGSAFATAETSELARSTASCRSSPR